uniref:Uncharacterized protein n=1 Tax=Ciona savignyi TaxID=51511 RepID=H2YGY4_CIOSA
MDDYCDDDYVDYDETFEDLEFPSTSIYENALAEWKKKYADIIMDDDDVTDDESLSVSSRDHSLFQSSSPRKRTSEKDSETSRQLRQLYSKLETMEDVVDKLEIESSANFALQDRIRMTQGTL